MASIHFASFCNLILNYWTSGLPPKISSVCVCFPSSKNESQTKAPKDASLQQADAELLKALKDDLGNLTWWPGWPESRFTSRPRWMNRPFSRLEKHKKFSIHVIFGTMKGAFLSLLDLNHLWRHHHLLTELFQTLFETPRWSTCFPGAWKRRGSQRLYSGDLCSHRQGETFGGARLCIWCDSENLWIWW